MLGRLLGGGPREKRDLAATLMALRSQSAYADSGELVTDDTALRLSTVWACVDLIARTGSTMPCDVVRYSGGSRVEVAKGSLLREPAAGMTLTQWLNAIYVSLLLRGNAYGQVVEHDGTYPTQIELLHPDCVSWTNKAVGGGNYWVPRIERQETRVWPLGDLWHLPAHTIPGSPVGLSPVEYARQSIGAGLAAERFSSRFFGADGHPSSILYSERDVTPDQARAIKDAFKNATLGTREPAVLGAGLKYESIQIAPEESQFLEAQRFSVEQVARFFGVSPEMVGASVSGASVTYANREQRTLDFLAFTMNPWLVRVEEALTALLPRPQVVKFNTNALLRSDTKTRFEVYQIASAIQTLTRNEIRAFEDMPPLEGGDEFPAEPPHVPAVDPNAGEPRQVFNIDAATNVAEGAFRNELTLPETKVENHVDARTDIHEGAIRSDVTVPVDATTALTEDSIRMEVAPVEVHVDATQQTREVRRRTIERNGDGEITAIVEADDE